MAKDVFPSPHPLTPPRSEDVLVDWFRLLRSRRVGPTTFRRLINEHGTAAAALEALPEVARAAGVDKYEACTAKIAAAEIAAGRRAGARPLCHGDPDYPALLAELGDAPPILWAIGDIAQLARPLIAIVGARNASSLGMRTARALARDLVKAGFTVVSGLARGIDTVAHVAALESGGPGGTIAVMAGGIDVVYPTENTVLAQEIGEKGLLLAEQPMHTTPQARHFPTRNRIVSGLCRAVIVVEAAAKSGSLITARTALDQGRDVMAVPGHPFDARSAGCNMLIRDGAVLVRSAEDVIEAIGPAQPKAHSSRSDADAERSAAEQLAQLAEGVPAAPPETRGLAETAALHSQILDRLGPSPLAEDQLIRDLGLPTQDISGELLRLELDGKLQRQPGGLLSRT